jgi:fructokinase
VPLVAGVELGGTKALVLLARGPQVQERVRVPTTEPAETLGAVSAQLAEWRRQRHDFAAVGIASFGPVGLDQRRQDFGFITTTPKDGWTNVDVRGYFAERFDVPIGFDTDVTGAALAEGRWGASQGCAVHVYITVGTGIGGGVVVGGRPVHGLVHPEHGHVRVRRRPGDSFAGVCPYHGDCIEGLASGPAIAARAGSPADQLGHDHPVWADVASELGELVATLVVTISPERIVLGGGVGYGRRRLLPRIRAAALHSLAGYVAALDVASAEGLVVSPALGNDAGPLGSIALGLAVLDTT